MANDNQDNKNISVSPPRFCPIHLKIHTCEETQISNIVKVAEKDLGARVRRLHGIQTEEERQAEAEKAKKNVDAKGSFGAILAAAKSKINDLKSSAKNNEIDQQAKAVTQSEVNDRMAALRNKMIGSSSDATENAPEVKKNKESKTVTRKKTSTTNNTTKKNSIDDSKRPKIYKESSDEINDYELDNIGPSGLAVIEPKNDINKVKKTSPTASKKTPTKKEVLLTIEQTQELIQEAVKKALEEAGIVKKDK